MEIAQFATSEKAWIELNSSLIVSNPLDHPARIIQSNQVIIYDMGIIVEKAYIDPEFSFTKTVNYSKIKWTSLVSNYIDFHELKAVIVEVKKADDKGSKNYNFTYHFRNTHGHGKGCLVSCTFSRMYHQTRPQLKVVMRASEFYKRGMMDLLLLQRMGELAYDDFSMRIHAHQLWGGVDWLSLMASVIKLKAHIRDSNPSEFAGRVLEKYRYFKKVEDPDQLKYHAHARAVKVIQGITRQPELLVKDCKLNL